MLQYEFTDQQLEYWIIQLQAGK